MVHLFVLLFVSVLFWFGLVWLGSVWFMYQDGLGLTVIMVSVECGYSKPIRFYLYLFTVLTYLSASLSRMASPLESNRHKQDLWIPEATVASWKSPVGRCWVSHTLTVIWWAKPGWQVPP